MATINDTEPCFRLRKDPLLIIIRKTAGRKKTASCEADSCSQRTTPVAGYSTLPTCETRTSGSIACSVPPACADGYYGTPSIDDVTCVAHGEELSVSGCTECTVVRTLLAS